MENNFNGQPDAVIALADGALYGLSQGASMDFKSSIIELTDNAVDAKASKIHIELDSVNNVITISSKEIVNLQQKEAVKVLFELGNNCKATTKEKGVGKYKQGLKYSFANLIGDDNKGLAQISVVPENGEPWAITNVIDHTDPNRYTDNKLYFTTPSDMGEYNFSVKISGAKIPEDKRINELIMILGIRYRELIDNNKLNITVNKCLVKSQDRLYSKYGKRAGYSGARYVSYKDNPTALKFEYCDLSEAHFDDMELISYDTSMNINRRQTGTAITSRAGIEIVVNGVSIISEGILEELIGKQLQPSGASWRGRLSINDNRIVDKYITGGNKSKCVINKNFIDDPDLLEIRQMIKDAHSSYIEKHKNTTQNDVVYKIAFVETWCENNNISTKFSFIKNNSSRETFIKDEANSIIEVSVNSKLFKNMNDKAIGMFIIALLPINGDTNVIFKTLKTFEHNMVMADII